MWESQWNPRKLGGRQKGMKQVGEFSGKCTECVYNLFSGSNVGLLSATRSEFSLRAGAWLGTSVCPMALLCHCTEHRANVDVHTSWADWEGCGWMRPQKEVSVASSWRLCLGSMWVVLGKWASESCIWKTLWFLLIM